MIGLEWLAAALTVVANLALARKHKIGWTLFALTNGLWVWWGLALAHNGFVVMEVSFAATNAYGFACWARDGRRD